jgi:cytochrome c biogenesis protein CcmG/thiol:disulfide interchange protein DsbE
MQLMRFTAPFPGAFSRGALLALPLLLLLLAFARPAGAGMEGLKIPVGDPAPDFTLEDLEGKEHTLSSLKGKKVVMIDFWATWCNICKREMPVLESVYKEYREKGVEFFGIALDEKVKLIKKIIADKGVTYPILLDRGAKVATESYQLAGPIPLKVVVDCAGIIRYTHVGDYPDYPPEVVFVFDELLEECPAP